MNEAASQGQLFIISGPSGVGKSSLVQKLLEESDRLKFSISYTTRPKRPQEMDGVHYHFIDQATFDQMVAEGQFLEHATYNNNSYGTPIPPINAWIQQGYGVILEIEVQGARQLREKQDQLDIPMHFIFILPPSFEHLKQRIQGRGTEDPEKQAKRLKIAQHELEQADHFDINIINDDFDEAYRQLESHIKSLLTAKEPLNDFPDIVKGNQQNQGD